MPDDLERLSAYLDRALSAADRSALEARLAEDEALRNELAQLRQTVQTLRNTPELAVPRNFTLDPAKYRRAAPWWTRYQRMQVLASLGTAAAVVLIVVGILLSGNQVGTPTASTGAAVAIQPTGVAEEADKTNEQSTNDAAQRSSVGVTSTALTSTALSNTTVQTNTPLPTATSETANLFALPATGTITAAATDQQAAQDGAASAPSVTATETFSALSASQPMATPTTMPPMLASTSVFKGATGEATALYAPPTAPASSAGDAGGSVAPIAPPTMPPTMVMMQATQEFGGLATPEPVGTLAAPAPITATVTFAPVANAVAPTETLPVMDTVTAATATATLAPPQPSQPASGSLPMLIIIGIPLLVFSLMLLAIVWIRSRMR